MYYLKMTDLAKSLSFPCTGLEFLANWQIHSSKEYNRLQLCDCNKQNPIANPRRLCGMSRNKCYFYRTSIFICYFSIHVSILSDKNKH